MERRLERSADPTAADPASVKSRPSRKGQSQACKARLASFLAAALVWALAAQSTLADEPPGAGDPVETSSAGAEDRQPGDPGSDAADDGASSPVGEPEAAASPAAATGETQVDRRSEIDRVVRDCWWNRPQVIAALTLEDAQREQMDAVMKEYLEVLYAPRDESLRRNPFRVALKRGDLDEATRVLDRRAQELAEETVREGRMMVAVLGHLSVDQREILGQKFPQVFRARWLMTFGQGGRGGRGTTPPRARRRSVDGPGGMQ